MSLNPTPTIAFTGAPSPDMQPSFNFGFSPDMQGTGRPVSLHFQNEDDVGSPAQRQQSSRPSSRPPTSNPSPSLTSKPRSGTYGNTSSPGLMSEPLKQRPRVHSHQPSQVNRSPIVGMSTLNSVQSMQVPSMSTGFDRPPLIHAMSQMSNDQTEGLYEYFPLTVDDWQPPVEAIFRPHVVHHEITTDSGPPPSRSSKRYFSEVA